MLKDYPIHSTQVAALIQQKGFEGLGLFYALASLAESTDFTLPASGPFYKSVAYQLRIDESVLSDLMTTLADLHLIKLVEENYVFTLLAEKRGRRRRAGEKGRKSNARHVQSNAQQEESNALQPESNAKHAENIAQQEIFVAKHAENPAKQPLPPHTPPSSGRDIYKHQKNARADIEVPEGGEEIRPPDQATATRWAMEDLQLTAEEAEELIKVWLADRRRKGWKPGGSEIVDWRSDIEFFGTQHRSSRKARRVRGDPPTSAETNGSVAKQSLRSFEQNRGNHG